MTILNKKEAESYLHEKYTDELHKEEKIFTDDIIEKIYLTSAGDKEAIDILCKQYLCDPATKKEERPCRAAGRIPTGSIAPIPAPTSRILKIENLQFLNFS